MSSQVGKIAGDLAQGSEKGAGTAGNMRLLGHKSWVRTSHSWCQACSSTSLLLPLHPNVWQGEQDPDGFLWA